MTIEECTIPSTEHILFKQYSSPKAISLAQRRIEEILSPEHLSIVLKQWNNIHLLCAKDYDITDAHLEAISTYCPQLKNLNLDYNYSFKMNALRDLLKKCNQLDILSLVGCHQLKDDDIKCLFTTTQPFQKLSLDHLDLATDTVEIILKSSPLLKDISLPNSFVSFYPDFMKSIRKKYPHIKF